MKKFTWSASGRLRVSSLAVFPEFPWSRAAGTHRKAERFPAETKMSEISSQVSHRIVRMTIAIRACVWDGAYRDRQRRRALDFLCAPEKAAARTLGGIAR